MYKPCTRNMFCIVIPSRKIFLFAKMATLKSLTWACPSSLTRSKCSAIQSRVQKKNLLPVVKDCDNQLMKPIEFRKLEFVSFRFTYFKVTFSRFKSRNRDYNTFQRKIGTYTHFLFFLHNSKTLYDNNTKHSSFWSWVAKSGGEKRTKKEGQVKKEKKS